MHTPCSNPGLAKSGLTRLIPTSLCSAMPLLNRRQFIHGGAVAYAYAAMTGQLRADYQKLKIGVTDWNLRHEAKPTSVAFAHSLGFDGVEISLGRAPDRLPLSDSALQAQFIAEAQKYQFPIESSCLDILHQYYLKSDPLGRR